MSMERKDRIRICPKDCHYRSKLVSYCGYCLIRILKEREETKNANRKNKIEHTE